MHSTHKISAIGFGNDQKLKTILLIIKTKTSGLMKGINLNKGSLKHTITG